jgi:hypothetical protein
MPESSTFDLSQIRGSLRQVDRVFGHYEVMSGIGLGQDQSTIYVATPALEYNSTTRRTT